VRFSMGEMQRRIGRIVDVIVVGVLHLIRLNISVGIKQSGCLLEVGPWT
jgi:hypothetical protein